MIYCPAGRDSDHGAVGHHKMGNVQELCLNIATQILEAGRVGIGGGSSTLSIKGCDHHVCPSSGIVEGKVT